MENVLKTKKIYKNWEELLKEKDIIYMTADEYNKLPPEVQDEYEFVMTISKN